MSDYVKKLLGNLPEEHTAIIQENLNQPSTLVYSLLSAADTDIDLLTRAVAAYKGAAEQTLKQLVAATNPDLLGMLRRQRQSSMQRFYTTIDLAVDLYEQDQEEGRHAEDVAGLFSLVHPRILETILEQVPRISTT